MKLCREIIIREEEILFLVEIYISFIVFYANMRSFSYIIMLSIVDLQWQNCVVAVVGEKETENRILTVEDIVVVLCG